MLNSHYLVIMRNFFAIAMLLFSMTMIFNGCDEKNSPEEILNNSSWQQAVNEHAFLANFPPFEKDFRGTYQELYDGESYTLAAWNISKEDVDTYKTKLLNAGFSVDADGIIYEKNIGTINYSASVSYASGMIGIVYSAENK